MTEKATESMVHALLCQLFAWYMESEDSGWTPISILHRVSTEGEVVRSGRGGHKILCREMKPEVRQVQVAFNSLEFDEKALVVTKHMPPPLKDNKTPERWGDKEKAHYLNEPVWEFKSKYRKILRKMKKVLYIRTGP